VAAGACRDDTGRVCFCGLPAGFVFFLLHGAKI